MKDFIDVEFIRLCSPCVSMLLRLQSQLGLQQILHYLPESDTL